MDECGARVSSLGTYARRGLALWVRLLGSPVDFRGVLAGRDDPVADYGDMFASVAPV